MGNVLGKTNADTGDDLGKESIIPLKGVVVAEMETCGKTLCRCNSGHLHGPYTYRYYRELGRLRKRYVRPSDLEAIRGSIDVRKRVQSQRRGAKWQIQRMIQELKQAGLW